MNESESRKLIDVAGGLAEFAKLLGVDKGDYWQQRVNNWRTRGIPSAVILEHYDTIQKLRAQLPVRGQKRARAN